MTRHCSVAGAVAVFSTAAFSKERVWLGGEVESARQLDRWMAEPVNPIWF